MIYKAYYEGETLYYKDEPVKGKDPVGTLCRQLGAGELHLYWEGVHALTVDIPKRKNWTLVEHPVHGLRKRKYEPLPSKLFN